MTCHHISRFACCCCCCCFLLSCSLFVPPPGRRDIIFNEFNTLSMVYDDHSDNFTLPEFRVKVRADVSFFSLSAIPAPPPPLPVRNNGVLLEEGYAFVARLLSFDNPSTDHALQYTPYHTVVSPPFLPFAHVDSSPCSDGGFL